MQSSSTPLQESTDSILVVSKLGVKTPSRVILDDLSFNVKKGTTLAIVGPNGSGKTTLFRALLNLIPHTGTISWRDGVRIGYVPQSLLATDLPVSVVEFLRFKCKTGFDECLSLVGLDNAILKQPLGSLSGGQLQRILIAWAIVDNPSVLLFDEPTSGVDIGAEEPIYQKVSQLEERLGITTLLISHNMHVVMHYSDYVLALNGRLLFYGETKGLSHSRLLGLMYGSGLELAEEDEHTHRE